MGIMVYSFLWVVQDLYHQPYHAPARPFNLLVQYARARGAKGQALGLHRDYSTPKTGKGNLL